jgi:hypothetical protein
MTKKLFDIKTVIKVLPDNTVITVRYLVSPNTEPRFISGSYVRLPQTSFSTH